MKFSPSRAIAFASLAASLVALHTAAAGVPKIRQRTYGQVYDQIQSVDLSAHTITIATMIKQVDENGRVAKQSSKQKHAPAPKVEKVVALNVDQFTDVSIDGAPSDLASLKPGMKVDVTRGTDDSQAASLVATQ